MTGLYVGNPLISGMIQLPNPPRGYLNPLDRNIQAATLQGGGLAAARALNFKQQFSYSWQWRAAIEADNIRGFYTGAWGAGPYVVLDPAAINHLRLDDSLMGGRRGVLTGWTPTVGTIAYDSTIATNDLPGGVARWTGAGATSVLSQGLVVAATAEADPAVACPYVSTEPYSVQIWGKTASGTASVRANVSARNAANTLHTDVNGGAVTLNSSTWQQMTATATAGFAAGAQFVIITVSCLTATAPDILLTSPQLELAAAPTARVAGVGAPRCSIVGTLDSDVPVITNRSMVLSFREN